MTGASEEAPQSAEDRRPDREGPAGPGAPRPGGAVDRGWWRVRFIRFVVVGVLNTAVGWGCFAVLVVVGVPRPAALLGATVLGMLWNFQATGRVVFGGSPWHLLPRFIAAYAGVYLFNLAVLEVLCRGFGVGTLLGQGLALAPTVVVSYFTLRTWVFAPR